MDIDAMNDVEEVTGITLVHEKEKLPEIPRKKGDKECILLFDREESIFNLLDKNSPCIDFSFVLLKFHAKCIIATMLL